MYKKDLYGKTIRKKIVFHGGFYMFGLIIALISGALMSIQGVFNTEVTKQSSTWTTSTFVQATGFLACLLIWLIAERDQSFTMLLKVSPRYLLLGGVIGAAITFTVIKSVASLGPAQSAMLIVASQSVVSYLIEVFGLFGVEKTAFAWVKLLGVVLFVTGLIIFKLSRYAGRIRKWHLQWRERVFCLVQEPLESGKENGKDIQSSGIYESWDRNGSQSGI